MGLPALSKNRNYKILNETNICPARAYSSISMGDKDGGGGGGGGVLYHCIPLYDYNPVKHRHLPS